MTTPNLLEQLRDIHLPDETSWWPLAIGWWILLGLLLLTFFLIIFNRLRKKRQFKYAALAINELTFLKQKIDHDWLLQLQIILRRVSFCYFPKVDIVKLNQHAWVSFLKKTGKDIWSVESLALLQDAAYQNPKKINFEYKKQLFDESSQWIEHIPRFDIQTAMIQLKEINNV